MSVLTYIMWPIGHCWGDAPQFIFGYFERIIYYCMITSPEKSFQPQPPKAGEPTPAKIDADASARKKDLIDAAAAAHAIVDSNLKGPVEKAAAAAALQQQPG